MKGIKILDISQNKLLRVTQKVTTKPESTGSTSQSREKSRALAVEPSNPVQLELFQWMNGQAIGC